MTVYVDDVAHAFGRMKMCHLWADSLAELHAFAARLGMQRAWFQEPPKASWQHYDISLSKKKLAISLGAVLTDRFGPAEHRALIDISSGDEARIARGRIALTRIEYSRSLRAQATTEAHAVRQP